MGGKIGEPENNRVVGVWETDPDYREFCAERLQDPYPLFGHLRHADPVHWSGTMNLWLVTRYADVHAGLRDPRFSSNRVGMYAQALPPDLRAAVQPLLDHIAKWVQLTDEPDHTRLRKLVMQAFTPRMVNALRSRIQELAEKLIPIPKPGEPFDLIEVFCAPLPAMIICEMLGIPAADRERFRRATHRIMEFSTRGGPALKDFAATAHAALSELMALFEELVAVRRKNRKDDLLGHLVEAEADGERLSNDELYAMCVFIFLAGHETTTNGIASGMRCLLSHPAQYELFRRDMEGTAAGLVEESLRYESPVPRAVRRAREDMEIAGRLIKEGQMVVLLLGAANRDPEQFPEPDRFDLRRQPNRHLAFGFGGHFCLGAQLARLEMEISFRIMTTLLPGLRLAAGSVRWKPMMGVRALESLVVTA